MPKKTCVNNEGQDLNKIKIHKHYLKTTDQNKRLKIGKYFSVLILNSC